MKIIKNKGYRQIRVEDVSNRDKSLRNWHDTLHKEKPSEIGGSRSKKFGEKFEICLRNRLFGEYEEMSIAKTIFSRKEVSQSATRCLVSGTRNGYNARPTNDKYSWGTVLITVQPVIKRLSLSMIATMKPCFQSRKRSARRCTAISESGILKPKYRYSSLSIILNR